MKNLTYTQLDKLLYALNLITNINSGYITGGLLTRKNKAINKLVANAGLLQKILNMKEIQEIAGNWEIVWGPFISYSVMNIEVKDYTKTLEILKSFFGEEDLKAIEMLESQSGIFQKWVTDNTMYMARCKQPPKDMKDCPDYFIGVAGTNFVSPFGWFAEDFDVDTVVPWKDALDIFKKQLPNRGAISKASAMGLHELWNMGRKKPIISKLGKKIKKGYRGVPKSVKTPIWDFIEHLPQDRSLTIAISGHSLGGALSPVLATALADMITAKGLPHKIIVMPTAGPTPGDQDFINHIHQKVENYHAIYNKIDVVPQAWIKEDLNKAPNFYPLSYGNYGYDGQLALNPNSNIVKQFMNWAIAQAGDKYARAANNQVPNHKFKITTWDAGPLKFSSDEDTKRFIWSYKILSAVLYRIPSYRNLLKTINGGTITEQGVNEFTAFLTYLGGEHVEAYLASDGFNMEEEAAAYKLFISEHQNISTAERILNGILTLQYVLKPLLQKVANWVPKTTLLED